MGAGNILLGIALLPFRQIWGAPSDPPYADGELQVRAAYYTENGKYRGGIPKTDSEYELFGCTELIYYNNNATSADSSTVRNATACVRWASDEVSTDEYKVDRCSCRSVDSFGDYCETWACSRFEVDHAILLEKEAESTQCTCETSALEEKEEEGGGAGSSGNFCHAWTCLTTGVHGGRWMEEFQCMKASSSDEYCDAWTGVVTSDDVISASSCACVQQLESVGVCLYWECERRGMTRCSHGGPGWCDIRVSIWVGGLFGSLGALLAAWAIFRLFHRARHPSHKGIYVCFVLLGFLWMAVWSIGVVIWGGQDGAMYVGIWWGALIVIDLLYACCTNCL